MGKFEISEQMIDKANALGGLGITKDSRGADKQIPDIALEVVKTHGAIDKLDVYRGLAIREVWVHEAGAFRILTLRGDHTPGFCGWND